MQLTFDWLTDNRGECQCRAGSIDHHTSTEGQWFGRLPPINITWWLRMRTCRSSQQTFASVSSKLLPTDGPNCRPTVWTADRRSVLPTDGPNCRPTVWTADRRSVLPTDGPNCRPTVRELPTDGPNCRPTVRTADRRSVLPTDGPNCRPTVRTADRRSVLPTDGPNCRPTVRELPTDGPNCRPTVRTADRRFERPSDGPRTADRRFERPTVGITIGTVADTVSANFPVDGTADYRINKVHQKDNISSILWYSDWLHNTTSAGNSIFVTNHNTTSCGRSIMQPIRLP